MTIYPCGMSIAISPSNMMPPPMPIIADNVEVKSAAIIRTVFSI